MDKIDVQLKLRYVTLITAIVTIVVVTLYIFVDISVLDDFYKIHELIRDCSTILYGGVAVFALVYTALTVNHMSHVSSSSTIYN